MRTKQQWIGQRISTDCCSYMTYIIWNHVSTCAHNLILLLNKHTQDEIKLLILYAHSQCMHTHEHITYTRLPTRNEYHANSNCSSCVREQSLCTHKSHAPKLLSDNYFVGIVDPCSSLAYFMMTQPLPIADKVPIKALVARQIPTKLCFAAAYWVQISLCGDMGRVLIPTHSSATVLCKG